MKILLLLVALTPLFGVTNSIVLRNGTGSTVSNYPLQFARPFVEGEIADYPQIGICTDATCASASSWLTTQADVKVRWSDGSVKHAILSVLVGSVGTGDTYLTFRNQATCNCGVGSALTKANLLDSAYNFDAQIQATTHVSTKTASARTMLTDWPQTTLAGDISDSATSITVADATGFPTAPFHIRIGDEEIKVTAKAGTTWTVARGKNSTTAAAHSNGAALWDTRVQYWVAGSVATTVVLADFSENHLYDFGWETGCDMALAGSVAASATTATVTDASCLTTPTYARLWKPSVPSGAFDAAGTASEAVYVCSKSGNTLNFGAVGCATVPSVAGRAQRQQSTVSASSFASSDHIVADNSWQEPSDPRYNSVKPMFVATFWPTINKVWVRVIAEIADTQRIQDQVYDVVVTTGDTSPTTVLSQADYVHKQATAWSRSYWVGVAPATLEIIHNIGYLASTGLVFNWDSSRSPSTSTMDAYWNSLQSRGTALGSLGPFTYYSMGATGGRPEISPENSWVVAWLYTGYDKARQVAFAAADMANSWMSVLREGVSTKKFDAALTIDGFGKYAVPNQRRTINLNPGQGYNFTSTAADTVQPVGPFTNWPFNQGIDREHNYNLTMPLYAVTGDWYYLQSGFAWASMASMMSSPNTSYGRGPTGGEYYVPGNTRTQAWHLRRSAQLATYTPDGTPEKNWATQLVRDYIATREGIMRLGNSYTGDADYTTMYNWGRNTYLTDATYDTFGGVISPMGLYMVGNSGFAQGGYGIDTSFVASAIALYEQGYMAVVLRLVKTMGLYPTATQKLLDQLKIFYHGAVNDANFNEFLLNNGRAPSVKKPSTLISTWADMKSGFWPTEAAALAAGATTYNWQGTTALPKTDAQHGYDAISLAALASVSDPSDTAWTGWGAGQQATFSGMANVPNWAILPFGAAPEDTAPTITSSSPLPTGVVGTPYSYQFTAAGSPSPTWSATGLPAWASLNSSGLLTGTPNAAATTSGIQVTAANGTSPDDVDTFSLTVTAAPTAPTITTTSLSGGSVGIIYTQTVAASGDTPITWSVVSGSLPGWASLNTSTGAISGIPGAAAVSNFTLRATNATGSDDQALSITVTAPEPGAGFRGITVRGVIIR